MRFQYVNLAGIVTVCVTLVCSVAHSQSPKKPAANAESAMQETDATKFIAANKGKIRVLLLGMPGCSGTEKATPEMAAYAKKVPEGVVVARLDVPLPGKTLTKAKGMDPGLAYVVDTKRKVADALTFFFYPTLYILDKDGIVRYSGKADMDKVRKMVEEIRTEDPAKPKKMYTIPLPKIGAIMKDFAATTIKGKKVTLKESAGDGMVFILFSTTSCPFSREAVQSLPDVLKPFAGKKLSVVILNFGQSKDEIAEFYNKNTEDKMVMVDSTSAISNDIFKVSVSPFFFILDKDRKVVARKPFTAEQAKSDIGKALGIKISCGTASGAG